jgi:hypothetical protein
MTNLQTMSREELIAQIAKMKADSQRKVTLKVSEKGALSVYGLGRFPVTLYAGQWERLLSEVNRIKDFLADNASLLATKE